MAAFHSLEVAEVRRETDAAVSIRLAVPDELRERFAFRAGQHLTFRVELGGEELRRNYSLCTAPHDSVLEVAVKRVAGGRFSTWASEGLRAGTMIDVMPPHGSFTWPFDAAEARRYLGMAGGSGITPVLSLLKTALDTEPKSRFTLLYGNRDAPSIMFLETLAGLKNRFLDRLEVYHFLEDEEGEVELFNGRLDRARCDAALAALVDTSGLDAVFICGPGPMMDAAEAALRDAGVPPARILIERFTAASSRELAASGSAMAMAAAGRRFAAILDGRRRLVPFDPAAGNLLDSARAAGLAAPYACKAGVCATCRAKVVAGRVEMGANYGLTADELAQGYVLTCQAVPASDGVVVDYDV